MTQITISIMGSFLLAFVLSLVLIRFSGVIGINDIPNQRSLHSAIIPRTGGIAIVISFFSLMCFTPVFIDAPYLFFCVLVVFLLGLYDDIKVVTPKIKFFTIFLSTLLLALDGTLVDSLGNYLGYDVALGIFALPFTIFAVIGFTNALNLIDGVDGLAGGVSMVILLTFAYVGSQFNDPLILYTALTLLGAIGGFLVFNLSPAKLFMGDSGSLTIGFILALLAILSAHYLHPVSMLFFLALPIIDTLVILIRRIRYNKSPFVADKMHIHHLLLDFFGSANQTTFFLMMTQSIFGFIGYVVARHIEDYPLGLFPIAMIISFVILVIMAYMLFTTILKNKGDL